MRRRIRQTRFFHYFCSLFNLYTVVYTVRLTFFFFLLRCQQITRPEMGGPFVGSKRYAILTVICTYVRLVTGSKNPVHGRKLCSPGTAHFQYPKIEKSALKTVQYQVLPIFSL